MHGMAGERHAMCESALSLSVATVPWDSVVTSRIMASQTEVQNDKADSLPRYVK